jgi:transposase InsO family protein
LSGDYDVQQLCEELGVSRSGYYDWRQRQQQPGKRATEDAALVQEIKRVHAENEEVYGSPRITRELKKAGFCCGRHRVARIMRCERVVGRAPRRFRVQTTDSNHSHPIAPNRLAAMDAPAGPNKVWVTDITYVPLPHGRWAYVAAVMDLFSRVIVGWAIDTTLETNLVIRALTMALARRRPAPGLIVHSDRGVQYASAPFRELLSKHGLIPSMSRRANCYDNAAMESFWSTFKMERLYRRPPVDSHELRRTAFQYIEAFYNTRRQHSSLGYLSPLDFESSRN